jgi:hypothetical protein
MTNDFRKDDRVRHKHTGAVGVVVQVGHALVRVRAEDGAEALCYAVNLRLLAPETE